MLKALFIISIAAIILLAGVQLGMKAGFDLAQEQNDREYIEQYILDHQQGE